MKELVGSRRNILVLLFALLTLVAITVPATAQNGYSYVRAITIDHRQVANTDQTDFPVLLSGTFPYLATTANGGHVQNASGYDIVFTSDVAGQNRLDYEIDSYDPTTGRASFWIRIPTLSHSVDTNIYMWYGNGGVSTSQENKTGAWHNVSALYHLNEKTASTTVADTLGNSNGSATANTSTLTATGTIGSALSMVGSNYVSVSNTSQLPSGTSARTLSGWVLLNSTSSENDLFGYGTTVTGQEFRVFTASGGNLFLWGYGAGKDLTGSVVSTGSWHHLAATYDGSTKKVYLDGSLNAQLGSTDTTSATSFMIGYAPSNNHCNCFVDEVKLENVVRSADWIATQYHNQSSPSTFVSIGSEYTGAVPLTTTTTGFSPALLGQSYSGGVSAAGGATPYSWSIASGSLPSGLSLSTSGLITGTPNTPGASSFVVQVTDSNNATATQAVSITVGVWSDQDIGSVGVAGSASSASGIFTVKGSGSDIWNSSDLFNFLYAPLSGDGTLIARVLSIQGGGGNAKAGVMIRETLTGGSTNVFTAKQGTGSSVIFDYRTATGSSTSQSGGSGNMPYWVKVVRSGNSFSGYISPDGVNWSQLGGTQTITMAQNVYIGLAVTSNNNSALATATFDSVSFSTSTTPAPAITSLSGTTGSVGSQITITGQNFGDQQLGSLVLLNGSSVPVNSWSATSITITIPSNASSGPLVVEASAGMNASNPVTFQVTANPLPSGWMNQDIGSVGLAGSATYSTGTFTVKAAGNDIWNASDSFHFVYQPLSGDGTLIARVVSAQTNSGNSKLGAMIRETLTPPSTNALAAKQGGGSNYFYYRTTTGGSEAASGSGSSFPYWVKVVRSGTSFSAYMSLDGVNWTQQGGTQTLSMAQNVYIGLAFTNNNTSNLGTVTFDNVSLSSGTVAAPVISSVSATSGSVGSQVVISGQNFGSSQGNSTVLLNGLATTVNSWSATSISVTIPSGAATGYLVVSLSPSGNNSNPVVFTVTSQPLQSGWFDQDIGATGVIGGATFSNGTYVVSGAGNAASGNADGTHFVYEPLTGDGSIVARLVSNTGGQAAVMIRETLNSGAMDAYPYFQQGTSGCCIRYYDRTATGASAGQVSVIYGVPPVWFKLTRSGNVFTSYTASDGVNWVQLGSATIAMAQNTYIGLAESSAGSGSLASATFDNVSIGSSANPAPSITSLSATTASVGSQVTINGLGFGASQGNGVVLLSGSAVPINSWSDTSIAFTVPTGATSGNLTVLVAPSMNASNTVIFQVTPNPLPAGWWNRDVGSVGPIGNATYSNGTFTTNGAGSGANGTADGFHFVYQQLTGDGMILAHVASSTGGQVVLMIRETLDSNATDAYVGFQPGSTGCCLRFNDRTSTGASAGQVGVSYGGVPYWFKLLRIGNSFTGYTSSDGVSWSQLGAATVNMAQTVYIGLETSSFGSGSLATTTFDNVQACGVLSGAGLPFSITNSSLPNGEQGVAYSSGLAAVCGNTPYTWSVASGVLPAGLMLNSNTGVISGTPTASGTGSFTIRVTDANGWTATKTFTPLFYPAVIVSTTSFPTSTQGTTFNSALVGANGLTPYSWSITSGSLPNGLSLASATGAITGTPSSSGTFNFSARVADAMGASATQALTLTVNSPVGISTNSLSMTTQGLSYAAALAATNGTTPYAWSLASGTLPAGLSLNAGTGAISGATTAAGTFNFTVQVADVNGSLATKALSILVNPVVAITTTSLPGGNVDENYSNTLAATGGTGALTWSVSSGTLPAGLSLNSNTGAITGVPTSAGTSSFTITATDTLTATATKSLGVTVVVAAPTITNISPSGGPPGTQVTISGQHLGDVQGSGSVSMSGIPATVSAWGPNSVTATVPAGATNGSTTVTNGAGATSNAYPFYSPLAPPFVSSVDIGGSVIGDSKQRVTATINVQRDPHDDGTGAMGVVITPLDNAGVKWGCDAPASPLVYAWGCYMPSGASSFTMTLGGRGTATSYDANILWQVEYTSDPGKTGVLTIAPLQGSLSIAPGAIVARKESATGTLTLNAIADGDLGFSLTEATQNGLYLPNYVTVKDGKSSGTFQFQANVTQDPYTETVYAHLGDQASWPSAQVTILPMEDNALGYCKDCQVTGGPINFANGNAVVSQSDYSLPGLGGGLSIARAWNSLWSRSSVPEMSGMFGHSWRSTYEERLQTVNGGLKYWRADGSGWTFLYNAPTSSYWLASPSNEKATLAFDNIFYLYTVTLADGSQRVFDSEGYLTAVVDRNGNRTTVAYDAAKRVAQVADPASRSITFTYPDSSTHQVQTVSDAVGTIATYTYDGSAHLTRAAYADGSSVNYGYAGDMITSVTDGGGGTIQALTYDGSSRALSSVRGSGADQISVSYSSNSPTQVTDSLGNVSTYSAGNFGNYVTFATTGSGCASCGGRGNMTFGYDAWGHRTSATDPLNRTTSYTYDVDGNVTSKSVPVSNSNVTWTFVYNSFGQPLTATDPLGNTTFNAYDAKGNLLSTTTPSPNGTTAGSTTTFGYNSAGQLTTITDPLGHTTNMAYTTAGLVAIVTDAQSNVTRYEYDARGNRTAVVDALSHRTTFAYDGGNRLTEITYPDTTTVSYGYDTRGRRTSVTDQNGRTTQYAYDSADRLTAVTDAASNMTQYAYDTESNLVSITDANGHTTSFTYDAYGRVTQTTFPSGLTETYSYDAVGNLLSKTDRNGNTISYFYDGLDRLTQKSYPDSTGVNYTYDAVSRLTRVSDSTGTYGFSYDNMGRLTGTSTQYSFLAGQTFANNYAYDAASNRTSVALPSGNTNTYQYDSLNRLTDLTNSWAGHFSFGYDQLSRSTTLSRPNGITTSYQYDGLSRLLSVLHQAGGTTTDGVTYTYDNADHRTSKTSVTNGMREGYSYDLIYELTQVVQGANATETYSYDQVGNRLSAVGVSSYSYNTSNELTGTPSATFTYDNNGNTLTKSVSGGTTAYSWDFDNRLASVTLPNGGGLVTFNYDPFGRRIQMSSPSGNTTYAYDLADIIGEYSSSGALLAKYAQGEGVDTPLAMSRQGTTAYYNADGLGSITSLVDDTQATVATYVYDSFGNGTNSTGSLLNPFRYTGREWDQDTGLYYYRFRYFDPSTGRFLNEDPIKGFGGINFYRYANGDPINRADPLGLKDVVVVIWNKVASEQSVGHVAVLDLQGNVIMSSFPECHCHKAKQVPKDWKQTVEAEGGRVPDRVFKVHVPNDAAFDAAVKDLNNRPTWDWLPTNKSQTNCVYSASHALDAGGVPVGDPDWPGNLGDTLFWMQVTHAPSDPWKVSPGKLPK